MREQKIKALRQKRRLIRVRKKIRSVSAHPRLSVFRSNNHIYAQVIDDKTSVTVLSVHENELGEGKSGTKIQKAEQLGTLLAQKAKEKKITHVVFDKGSYRYHGRVKVLAEAARKEGLQF